MACFLSLWEYKLYDNLKPLLEPKAVWSLLFGVTWEVRICHVCYVWLSCRSRPVGFCPNAPGVAPAASERRLCQCLSVQAVRSDYSDSWHMDGMAHRNTLHDSWPIWHFHGNWATEQLSHGKTSNPCQELVVPELCSADQVLAACGRQHDI